MKHIPGFAIDVASIETNIVIIDISARKESTSAILEKIKRKGVLLSEMSSTKLRAVTHMDVSMKQVETAAAAIKSAIR